VPDLAAALTVEPLHLAFLVDETTSASSRPRSEADGTAYTADPPGRRPGRPARRPRRLYSRGPGGHLLEGLTQRYTDVPAGSRSR
jgi:hypothetical protein